MHVCLVWNRRPLLCVEAKGGEPVSRPAYNHSSDMTTLKDELAALKIERPAERRSRPWIKWFIVVLLLGAAGFAGAGAGFAAAGFAAAGFAAGFAAAAAGFAAGFDPDPDFDLNVAIDRSPWRAC